MCMPTGINRGSLYDACQATVHAEGQRTRAL